MGAENRIQKLNRELRELATNARREREEFSQYTTRQRGSRRDAHQRASTNEHPSKRTSEE